jgi:glucose-6-phosphate 1-dehydrogenase
MKNTIVIFGATGDLARLKLLPAVDTLKEISGDEYNVIACGRREMTTEGYISYLSSIDTHPYAYTKNYSLRYIQLSYAPEHIENEELWSALKDPGRLLFFLALGPDAVMATLNILESTNVRKVVSEKKATVVLEKPYGESLNNALEIVGRLNKIFGEKNVLLSDHYLHKRSVKSIDRLKVNSNDLLSAISPTNLTDVRVIISEQVDIGSRAGYFDCRGMVIDWVQSHILQLLSSILVPREYLDGNKKAEWKADFLKHLHLEEGSIIRGQYEGYIDTNGVNPDCGTETFFACRLRSKKAEWGNISFSVIAGKALKEKSVCLNFVSVSPIVYLVVVLKCV